MRRGLFGVTVAVALLAAASPGRAQPARLDWSVEGYYRARGVSLMNLAPEPERVFEHPALHVPVVVPDLRRTSYLTQRLRLSPTLTYGTTANALARLSFEVNAVDDVLWGDNNAVSAAPLFAVNPSSQYYLGGDERGQATISRAWVEFQVPVGLMRVGRMPSHWGMGLLANGGGSGNWDPTVPVGKPRRHVADYYFDDDFGDNHFGSTNDRILFATRPLSIVKAAQKKADIRSNLVVAYAFDKLSEAPLYLAEPDRAFRPLGQQGFISRGPDDVNEHVFVLSYANPDWDQVAFTDELKLGTYQVLRTQARSFTEPSEPPDCDPARDPTCALTDEGSLVWIADAWYRLRYGPWYSEGEALRISGKTTGGVPFPAPNTKKEAAITGAVLRLGYLTEAADGVLEAGYASGDDDLTDLTFKQRALHPDFRVGLILFPEVVRERSARVFGPPFMSAVNPDGIKGFMSSGGVVNAKYLMPKVRFRPAELGLEIIGAALFAWVDEWAIQPPNVFVEPLVSDSKYLGTELDLAVKSRFADEHLDVSLEAGYLFFGQVLKTRSDGSGRPLVDPPIGAFSLQARVAYLF